MNRKLKGALDNFKLFKMQILLLLCTLKKITLGHFNNAFFLLDNEGQRSHRRSCVGGERARGEIKPFQETNIRIPTSKLKGSGSIRRRKNPQSTSKMKNVLQFFSNQVINQGQWSSFIRLYEAFILAQRQPRSHNRLCALGACQTTWLQELWGVLKWVCSAHHSACSS